MKYVDGFVAPVSAAKREEYIRHAAAAAQLFKEYGALSVVECWGNDVPEGKRTSFTMAVQREPDETTVFSWIIWPSRQARDAAWDKLMADERMKDMQPPFDGKRMIHGGFEMLLDA